MLKPGKSSKQVLVEFDRRMDANHQWVRDIVEWLDERHTRNWWLLWACVQVQFLIAILVGVIL